MKKRNVCKILATFITMGLVLSACGKEKETAQTGSIVKEQVTVEDNQGAQDSQGAGQENQAGTEDSSQGNDDNTQTAPSFEFATAGPAYVYGTGKSERYLWSYSEDEVAYTGVCRYVYLATPGYDGLKASLNEYNAFIYQDRKENDNMVADMFYAEAESIENGEEPEYDVYGFPWSYDIFSYVERSDSKVFSMVSLQDMDMGGAHPSSFSIGVNFDTVTGKELLLDDVVTDTEELKKITIAAIEQEYDTDEEFFMDWKDSVDGYFAENAVHWVYNEGGLEIWFNTYEIAPYYVGAVHAEILYKDFPSLFKPEYLGADTNDYDPGLVEADVTPQMSGLYRDAILKFASQIGETSFGFVGEDVNGLGFEYFEQMPGEESDGEITVYDNDSQDYAYLFFWPDRYDTPILNSIWYKHGSDYRAIIDMPRLEGDIQYEIVYDNLYEAVYFDNFDEMTAALFVGLD